MSDMEQFKEDVALVREHTAKIRAAIGVTKVVVTRSVKGRGGDTYVGMSAAWDTIQDDAGGGGDLMNSETGKGLTLKEAKLASLVLGLQVDLAAHQQAMAGGSISPDQYETAKAAISHNYTKAMADHIRAGLASKEGSKA